MSNTHVAAFTVVVPIKSDAEYSKLGDGKSGTPISDSFSDEITTQNLKNSIRFSSITSAINV